MSMPRTSPPPASIVMRPSKVRMRVVLPAPFGASRPTAPRGASTDSRLRAVIGPYVLVTVCNRNNIVSPGHLGLKSADNFLRYSSGDDEPLSRPLTLPSPPGGEGKGEGVRGGRIRAGLRSEVKARSGAPLEARISRKDAKSQREKGHSLRLYVFARGIIIKGL